jgi:hypothetical protein
MAATAPSSSAVIDSGEGNSITCEDRLDSTGGKDSKTSADRDLEGSVVSNKFCSLPTVETVGSIRKLPLVARLMGMVLCPVPEFIKVPLLPPPEWRTLFEEATAAANAASALAAATASS